ncbi:MAG: hypothetical protein II668_02040, partial [Oscillospiraceae bacterium]|nr:hypothetical protein [Oscillospiraceae bacterium]
FDEADFSSRFGFSFFTKYQKAYDELHKAGLIDEKDGRVFATDKGILLLDRILVALF